MLNSYLCYIIFIIQELNMNTISWNDLAELSMTIDSSYNNLLLIDANNVAYRWLQRINYNNFASDYQRTVQSLSKSYEACRTIVCFDFGRSYYRMNMYDQYKQNRKKPKEEDEAKIAMLLGSKEAPRAGGSNDRLPQLKTNSKRKD